MWFIDTLSFIYKFLKKNAQIFQKALYKNGIQWYNGKGLIWKSIIFCELSFEDKQKWFYYR